MSYTGGNTFFLLFKLYNLHKTQRFKCTIPYIYIYIYKYMSK